MLAYQDLSDAELLKLLKASDYDAYTEIYYRFSGLLYVFVCKRINNADDSRDILQELFTKLWLKRETIEVSGPLAAYLYTAVRNTMLNFIEKNMAYKRLARSLDDYTDQEPVMSDHLIREKQLARLIEKEVDALPVKMRKAFLLSRNTGLTHSQIAQRLNLSKETVSSHTKRALKILRLKLASNLFLLASALFLKNILLNLFNLNP